MQLHLSLKGRLIRSRILGTSHSFVELPQWQFFCFWLVLGALFIATLIMLASPAKGTQGTGNLVALEVLVEENFETLDFSVVMSVTPTIRVRRHLPGGFRVFNDRPDGRAGLVGGFNGYGREITDFFREIERNVWEGTVPMLIGANTILITNPSGTQVFKSGTMLNFSQQFEDLNGNELLDQEEDRNQNNLLDLDEDLNGNGLADFGEDGNANGTLELDEDINRNGLLDPGEDVNANDLIDPIAQDVIAHRTADDVVQDPYLGLPIHEKSLLLEFLEGTTPRAISAYLREKEFQPIGISFDALKMTEPRFVTVALPAGSRAYEVERELNGLPVTDISFPPPFLLADPPLKLAIVSALAEIPTELNTPSEALPERLIEGKMPNTGEGYEPSNGGFDYLGHEPDELELVGYHFFLETFAAHRLITHVSQELPIGSSDKPVIAIVDTGLGDGSDRTKQIQAGSAYDGIPLYNITDCTLSSCSSSLSLDQIKDQSFDDENGNGIRDNDEEIKGHGTPIAFFTAGNGDGVLGTGRSNDLEIWPVRVARLDGNNRWQQDGFISALKTVARDPRVHVVNYSWGLPDADSEAHGGNGDGTLDQDEQKRVEGWRDRAASVYREAIQALETNKKIFVLAGGGEGRIKNYSDEFSSAVVFNVPKRRLRVLSNQLALSVGATRSPVLGREEISFSSLPGSRLSVSAPGKSLVCTKPSGATEFRVSCDGSSLSAPMVAGLLGELSFLNNVVAPITPLQIVQLVEATADDLGTGNPDTDPRYPDNSEPGNGPDNRFGWGRINVWKAVLSRLNGGVAEESHPSLPFPFSDLSPINAGNTTWYGFRIITSVKDATVWINGEQLTDNNSTIPGGPKITAYKGVRSHPPMFMGIDINRDGVLDENPTDGVVPVGTENVKGEYIITFSIRRDALEASGVPKVLSLRKPSETNDAPPFFNLKLELAKMRTGRVPGVVFDDFVFEITPTDFGDAPDGNDGIRYPTLFIPRMGDDLEGLLMRRNGARHLNSNLEWFGKPGPANIDSVSAEVNSAVSANALAPDPMPDPDGTPNFINEGAADAIREHDLDRADDGIRLFPLTYRPRERGKVEFTVCSFDNSSSRYENHDRDPDQLLYVNAWFDWNTNGIWEEENNEHPLNGIAIYAPFWSLRDHTGSFDLMPYHITLPNGDTTVRLLRIYFEHDCATFESEFTVGEIGDDALWARFRLDYGEDAGRNDPRRDLSSQPRAPTAVGKGYQSDLSLRDPSLTESLPQPASQATGYAYGAARFGEVEDYRIGADFGDAPDLGANQYPTRKNPNGARHLDINKEWLGDVKSRETDGCDETLADQDSKPNLGIGCEGFNQDADDGVTVPRFVNPGEEVSVSFTARTSINARGYDHPTDGPVSSLDSDCTIKSFAIAETPIASRERGRYNGLESTQSIYVNAWADWDGDRVWEDTELVLAGLRIAPETFGVDGRYTLGEPFTDTNRDGVWESEEQFQDQAGKVKKTFTCKIQVPPDLNRSQEIVFWRFRLDYGENVTQTDLGRRTESTEEERNLAKERGGALFGEVEDVTSLIPPGIPKKVCNRYSGVRPTENIHYTIFLPAAEEATTPLAGSITDVLPEEVDFAGNLTCSVGACDYNPSTRTASWSGDLAPGTTVVLDFDTTVLTDGPRGPACPSPGPTGPGGGPPPIVNRAAVSNGLVTTEVMIAIPLICQ